MPGVVRLLDVALVLVIAVIVGVIVTGGWVIEPAGLRIRMRSADNPFWIAFAVAFIRYTLRPHPHPSLPATALARLAAAFRPAWKPLLAISAVVFILKVAFAWTLPGFFSGDDVEIHEMTLGPIVGRPWPVWELRNAFYPMCFIWPAQRLAWASGVQSPEGLVFAGRLVVAALSTLVIPMTWIAARRLWPDDVRIAAGAVVFVAVNKLMVAFGSSELPRPVATVFVIAAFTSLLRRGGGPALLGGLLLGIGAAFRFSEAMFIGPAMLVAVLRRDWLAAATVPVAAVLTLATIVGVADLIYWGEPFFSLRTAIDYTLLERGSSRGFQPVYEYLAILPSWTTLPVFALAVAGSRRCGPETLWLWIPLLCLSLLPHKETRYVIPLVPMLALTAARGLVRTVEWLRQDAGRLRSARWIGGVLVPMLALSLLHDAAGWRLRRTNEGVGLARYLRSQGTEGVAAEHSWRMGGQAYLWRHEPVVDLPPERLATRDARAAAFQHSRWVALRTATARAIGADEMRLLGFEASRAWSGEDYVLFERQGSLK